MTTWRSSIGASVHHSVHGVNDTIPTESAMTAQWIAGSRSVVPLDPGCVAPGRPGSGADARASPYNESRVRPGQLPLRQSEHPAGRMDISMVHFGSAGAGCSHP